MPESGVLEPPTTTQENPVARGLGVLATERLGGQCSTRIITRVLGNILIWIPKNTKGGCSLSPSLPSPPSRVQSQWL